MGKRPVHSFVKQMLEYKRRIQLLIVITICILAILFVATAVVLIIDLSTDKTQPEITKLVDEIEIYVGEGISYKNKISVTDNHTKADQIEIEIDSSNVDTNKPGTYTVKYTATDKAGNSQTCTIKVIVKSESDDAVKGRVTAYIESVVTDWNVSVKTDICKKIYEHINDPSKSKENARFTLTNVSNTNRDDFYAEADLFIQKKSGDCYSFFALSKAFFVYFDIQSKDIERTKNVWYDKNGNVGTHFWNLVNIGTSTSPNWYFFDATRLADPIEGNSWGGCLFNEAQRQTYNKSTENYRKNFYTFNSSSFPAATGKIINSNFA